MVAGGILAKRNVASPLHHDVLETVNACRRQSAQNPTILQLQIGLASRRQRHGPVGEIGGSTGPASRSFPIMNLSAAAECPGTKSAAEIDVDVFGGVPKSGGENDRVDHAAVRTTKATDVDVSEQRFQALPRAAKRDGRNRAIVVLHQQASDVSLETAGDRANDGIGW